MLTRTLLVLSLAGAVRLVPAAAGAGAVPELPRAVAKSACVRCHARTGKGGVVYPEYIRWVSSPHAAKNVGCEACHGGDPTTDDKDKSHAGMIPPGAADSPVSPKKVPQTCGQCHEMEYQHYVQSKHSKKLADGEQGATCVTCHGSTATAVPTAVTVRHTCEICHTHEKHNDPSIPERAYHALLALTEARGGVDLAQVAVLAAKDRKQDTAALERNVARARDSLNRAITEWHTFDLAKVEQATSEAQDLGAQTRMLAEHGVVGGVLLQGKEVFWQVVFLVLLTAVVVLNVLVLLRVTRHPPPHEGQETISEPNGVKIRAPRG